MRLYIIALFVLIQFVYAQKLLLVQQLFRHGARYPIHNNKNDGSDIMNKTRSAGELTTQGKAMHHMLGKKVYEKYWDQIFKDTPYDSVYNQSKFYIKSTDVNRTIESVQSHLLGLFEHLNKLTISEEMVPLSAPQWPDSKPTAGDVFPNAAAFHPTAIHVQKIGTDPTHKGDFLRTYDPVNCPQQRIWETQNKADSKIQQIRNNPTIVKALQALSAEVKTIVDFTISGHYTDTYYCLKHLNIPYLKVYDNPQYLQTLSYIYTMSMYIDLYHNRDQIRATSTGFFNATKHNFQNVIKDPNGVQWVIYSAHDTTVGNMLAGMNMTNVNCIYQAFLKNQTKNQEKCVNLYPFFASSLIFQLYEEDDQTHTFSVLYNGEHRKIPFCDYQLRCPVETFYKWYDNFKDQDFLKTCGVTEKQKKNYQFSILIIEFAIIFIFALFFIIKYLKKENVRKTSLENRDLVEQVGHESNREGKIQQA